MHDGENLVSLTSVRVSVLPFLMLGFPILQKISSPDTVREPQFFFYPVQS